MEIYLKPISIIKGIECFYFSNIKERWKIKKILTNNIKKFDT